ncbi:hypothetical protein AWC38_SpisGene24005 [Stylophora pistillata]|uniref:Methyltransferase type 11 domain-containing protein n=1 Tax=Stylophora pistillata TaxID=50429 RepID=A0A2B4R5J7_STYPI|nr:hypothetical protein AWC38_SpisGene24005 [Stylophora pistillata]
MKPVTNRAIVELNPSSTEDEAKKLYDSWAANYEAVSCSRQSERAWDNETIESSDTRVQFSRSKCPHRKEHVKRIEAKKKNVYKRLICAPLSDVRIVQIKTAEYDVTFCAGTIVYGQAKPVALDECIRHVRPGGLFIFTLRADSLDPKYDYCAKFYELEKAGKWSLVNRELRELYTNPREERFRECYSITYKGIQN